MFFISLTKIVFFSLFFAMLIGDAGYGLIFLAATYFFQKKFTHIPRQMFALFYILAGATVFWGTIIFVLSLINDILGTVNRSPFSISIIKKGTPSCSNASAING